MDDIGLVLDDLGLVQGGVLHAAVGDVMRGCNIMSLTKQNAHTAGDLLRLADSTNVRRDRASIM